MFSESLSEQGIAVMSARELQEMHDKHAIIFHRNYKPMKALRLKWWQSPILKKRQGLTPPTLYPLPHIPDLPKHHMENEPSDTLDAFINPDTILNYSKRRGGIWLEK